MKKSKTMKKVLAVVLALTMVLGMSAVAFADAAAGNVTVYVTVERTLVGNQDPILAPTAVSVPAGSDVFDVLTALKAENKIDFTYTEPTQYQDEYITGFKAPSHAAFNYLTDYEFWTQFNAAAGDMGDVYFDYSQPPKNDFLSHGDYCMLAGWIVSLNNKIKYDDESTKDVNEASPTMGTVVKGGDVLRFEYTFALARDAGYQGFSLLDLKTLEDGFYTAADKGELIQKMADNPTSPAYAGAMTVLKNMTATQAVVDAAAAEL